MNLWIRQWLSSWPLLPPEPPSSSSWWLKRQGMRRRSTTQQVWRTLDAPSPSLAIVTSIVTMCIVINIICVAHKIWLNVGIYNSAKWSLCNHSLWFKFKHPDTFILIFGQFLGKREKCYTCTFDDQTALVLRHKLTNWDWEPCLSCHHDNMIIAMMMVNMCTKDGVGVCLGKEVISAPSPHFHLPTTVFFLNIKTVLE